MIVLDNSLSSGLVVGERRVLDDLKALAHETLILCLTKKTDRQPSLGSLVSVRGQAHRIHQGHRFMCQVHVLKDKRRGPGWTDEEWCRGPDGLC